MTQAYVLPTKVKQKVYNFARVNMGRELSHDFSHAERVALLAKSIAHKEGEDQVVAEIAGLLHDIGLGVGERSLHGEIGAHMARQFLQEECGAYLANDVILTIVYAVSWHNRKFLAPQPCSILDIVVDADTLDLLGAVGIWRGIAALNDSSLPSAGSIVSADASFQDYDDTLAETRATNTHGVDTQLNFQMRSAEILATKTAKKLAEPLLTTMKSFRYMLANELSVNTYG